MSPRRGPWRAGVVVLLTLAGCRGERPAAREDRIARLVDSLRPVVERTVGRDYRRPPRLALRSQAQVRTYIAAKLAEQLPPERLRGIQAAYRLFGLVPDSLDLGGLLLELFGEQVAGFYEPDSSMLFVLEGSDPGAAEFKFVVAHEMVHALQHDYVALDSILDQRRQNDRQTAAQAVLEGEATLASIMMMLPAQDVLADETLWETFREQLASARSTMAVFGRAPRVLQEGLVFPYLGGAEFMRWWRRTHGAAPPYGAAMPRSTEQILHPERYARGDAPVPVRFLDPADDGVLYEDDLGELEIRILAADLTGEEVVSTTVPIGWGGDRYRVMTTPDGPALVWYTLWDDARAADGFLARVGRRMEARSRAGYRTVAEPLALAGRAGVRVIVAPAAWPGWTAPPRAEPTP